MTQGAEVEECWRCAACKEEMLRLGIPIPYYREVGRKLHCFKCDRMTRHTYVGEARKQGSEQMALFHDSGPAGEGGDS